MYANGLLLGIVHADSQESAEEEASAQWPRLGPFSIRSYVEHAAEASAVRR